MILQVTRFRVKVIEAPKRAVVVDGKQEIKEIPGFTLNRKYSVFSIWDGGKHTEFLLADDEGRFVWIDSAYCRRA